MEKNMPKEITDINYLSNEDLMVFGSLEKIIELTRRQLSMIELEVEAKLKKLICDKLHKMGITKMTPADVFVQVQYPIGWICVVNIQEKCYFVEYDYADDSCGLINIPALTRGFTPNGR